MKRALRFCDALIEAGWLLALVLVPLFFDVYSSRVFEPDKIALLRIVTLVSLFAALGKWLAEMSQGDRPGFAERARVVLGKPLVIPSLALAVVYVLATALSVAPRTSLWGSYQRLQGTYTWLCYVALFLLAVIHIRQREQVDRLVWTALLTSLPVSLYGILQHYNLDPLPWGGDTAFRVTAHMGNAIFVAAFLIMVIPLAVARVLQLGRDATAGSVPRAQRLLWLGVILALGIEIVAWVTLGFYGGLAVGLLLIALGVAASRWLVCPTATLVQLGAVVFVLGAQLVCLLFSQSRGPWLGLAAGLFFLSLLYLLATRRRALAATLLGLAVVLGGLLYWVNLPGSVQDAIRGVPYVGRLGRLLEVESGTGKVRVLIWEGAAEMVTDDAGRALVGYGPESMYVAYPPYYPADLAHYEARNRSPDRSHNETYDALVTTGVIGLVAEMVLFGAILMHGLEMVGLVSGRDGRRLLLLLLALGAVTGAMLPYLAERSWRYSGVGIPLGFLVALALYLVWVIIRMDATPTEDDPVDAEGSRWRLILVVGLVSAIIAHFVEIQFGIAIVATRTYFWLLAALVAALGSVSLAASDSVAERSAAVVARNRARRKGRGASSRRGRRVQPLPTLDDVTKRRLCASGMLIALVLCVLVWEFVGNAQRESSIVRVLWQSLTTMAAARRPDVTNLGVLWMLLGTLVVGAVAAVAAEAQRIGEEPDARWWWSALARTCAVAGGVPMVYALVHAIALVNATHALTVLHLFVGWLAVLWWLLAGSMIVRTAHDRVAKWASIVVTAGAFVLVYALTGWANVRSIDADVVYKQGLQAEQTGDWDLAASAYYQAHLTAPEEDYYLLFLGRALLQSASQQTDAASRDARFLEALGWLNEARRLNPLNPDHTANLARLYRNWAVNDPDPASKDAKLREALSLYADVTQHSPSNAQLHNEWALTYVDTGDLDAALEIYDKSLAIDSQFLDTYLLIGELYHGAGDWEGALVIYESALEVNDNSPAVWASIAGCYANLADWEQAIDSYRRSLDIDPESPNVWAYLGDAYSRNGQMAEALGCYKQAVALYPDYQQAIRAWADHALYLQAWEDAAEALTRLVQMLPQDYQANYKLALAYTQMGRATEAQSYAERAVALAETDAQREEAQQLFSSSPGSDKGETE